MPGKFPACMVWKLASPGSPFPNLPSTSHAAWHIVKLALCLQEDRQWALVRGLEHINRQIEGAAGDGVPCWFPMGTRDERILRLPAKEAILLNSRCGGLDCTLSVAGLREVGDLVTRRTVLNDLGDERSCERSESVSEGWRCRQHVSVNMCAAGSIKSRRMWQKLSSAPTCLAAAAHQPCVVEHRGSQLWSRSVVCVVKAD